ncbi:MAG: hypothetical protein Ta2A_04990 [Treponemataceae bacterium]|nr:MAG: hypothetical protein Ta2A_04990 [Treponemataceae bacterium]
MNEYKNFQCLLAWFAQQLLINNDFKQGTHVSGPGHKGHKIRDNYIKWRSYSVGEIDISMQLGYPKDTEANYIHWYQTWVNTVAVRETICADPSILRLRIIDKKDNKERKEYLSKTCEELGVSTFPPQNDPNDNLKKFFETFKVALRDYESAVNRSPEEIDDTEVLVEGAKMHVTINAYERSDDARRKCIEHYGTKCCICGTDLASVYGAPLSGKIVVHHITPLAKIDAQYTVDPINDLLPVCPNCHFALHSKKDGVFTPDEMRAILKK